MNKKILINGTILLAAAFLSIVTLLHYSQMAQAKTFEQPKPAPQFTQSHPSEWINSAPLSIESFRGKVVLLDIWTYACWNCYRSFPWLNSLEEKYQDKGLQVIGIHTPEFEHERNYDNVVAKAKEFKLHHPIMLDNDFAYWNALNNQYWPAYYLIDKQGKIRHLFIGETHQGDSRAKKIERAISELLSESDSTP